MPIDFEPEFGVNAGYVQTLFDSWSEDPSRVEEAWAAIFRQLAPAAEPVVRVREAPPPAAAVEALEEADQDEALRGVPAKIAENMATSLELPTATSFRTLPVKILEENRKLLNEHMQVRALGKASYTHLIAFALARALRERPAVQARFELQGGKPHRVTPRHVNLGLAIDVPTAGGRSLVVPAIARAETLGFKEFLAAYEDLVTRGREGRLTARDFQGTTATLTNPGGFGTGMSVPRLMKGQGLIVATGSIGLPPESAGMSFATRAELAIGPVMTASSTYDHRVIQGAESGLLLQRLEQLLNGEEGFYEEIFEALRVPWTPARPAVDVRGEHEEDAQAQVWLMINAYRVRGCYLADLDPLAYHPDRLPSLDPVFYGFTVWDLDREFLTGGMRGRERMTLREILAVLRQSYCRRWTCEYMHIADRKRKHYMRDVIENQALEWSFEAEHRLRVLRLLSRAENFERFLHSRYVGNKRFSLEGADTLIPALAELIELAARGGVEKVVIGMAHRGRLNVLANILNKSREQIFREFEGVLLPLSSEGSGDVKYHLGQRGTYRTQSGAEVEVILSANPSHLEAVDPVVCGMVRAFQDELGDGERKRVLAIQIHGDAAFSGQGVVTETLQMSALPAHECGGSVHLVVNNQIGFTTGPRDARSTYYCTDVAKGIQAPILHANGDYPESVLRAVRVAVEYQREFGRDAVIDMVCYRRHGHNEGDEPAYTQPLLYERIRSHPTVSEHYKSLLIRRGALTEAQADEIREEFDQELRAALEASRAQPEVELAQDEVLGLDEADALDWTQGPSPQTGVARETLARVIDSCNRIPEGHVPHPKLLRQLRRREEMVRGAQDLDWGCAEALALGTLLLEGVSIRLVGQDSGRGTFSHRHAVIRDQRTEQDYVPLDHLSESASFEVRDSLLSEEAALAFEYGYALARPRHLVLWEAQFGDFLNGAQIPIDQFIAAGETKWRQTSGLVLLLPHGYDGQGPEHSNAHPERLLALCSTGNMAVCNCSTSAQYFHLLRRQGLAQTKRPLFVLTPKSLLRQAVAASPIEDFAEGRFQELLEDPAAGPVRRIVLSSGKVHYDLVEQRAATARDDVTLVRLEQLYPFPKQAVLDLRERHPDARLVWCQEEPRNMGAWAFVLQALRDLDLEVAYTGRPVSASPATGSYKRHQAEQAHLVARAFDLE
jgi:2-oxoglutarate dehydrogenase E1 component